MTDDWGGPHACTLVDHLEDEYGVPLGEARGDADFDHLYNESRRLCSDPSGYVDRLRWIANRRLREERFRDELEQAFDDLRTRFVGGSEAPHAVAEALQIVTNDLPMIEEVAGYGAPKEVVDDLCNDLVDAALFIAGRLVLNAGQRLRAGHRGSPSPIDATKVKPLEEALGNELPEVIGSLDFYPGEPVLVVATAGRGTRLHTTIPKALLPLAGCSFLGSILKAARGAGIRQSIVILKHRAKLHPPAFGPELTYLIQNEALGTGHSFATALRLLSRHDGPCVLSYSDTPFLSTSSFQDVLAPLASTRVAMVILAVGSDMEPEFGRLVESGGKVRAIVQPRFGEKGGHRADGGLYACRVAETLPALLSIRNHNHRYEYSFTEVVAELDQRGHKVAGIAVRDPREVVGVNRPAELVRARRLAHQLQNDIEFFRPFGGAGAEALSPAELLQRSNRYTEYLQHLVGPTVSLDDS